MDLCALVRVRVSGIVCVCVRVSHAFYAFVSEGHNTIKI